MKNFFVSYTQHDRGWAEWIAWQLEENNFSVVIQAWDFAGNWVMKMDEAMRETERTIIVLSPHYVKALFTRSEWADAFRRDPTGDKDILVPVRVEAVELDGLLAQVVYVDLVGKDETEAQELLLKRARGQRGKPSVSPLFPSGQAAAQDKRTIAARPIYPAETEDLKQVREARDAMIRWRGLYAAKLETLRIAGARARGWSRHPPEELDDEVGAVIGLAENVAENFRALPVQKLEFAKPYGLGIHPTVFWGNAQDDVAASAKSFAFERSEVRKKINLLRIENGLKPTHSLVLNAYGFEMIARVLESALELAQFNPDALPRGYRRLGNKPEDFKSSTNDLSAYQSLLMARIDEDPALHVVSPDKEIKILGSFAARSLKLFGLCARRNSKGLLDLVAHDFEHLYYWIDSSPQPNMQFPIRHARDAKFLSAEPASPVAVVDYDGAVETVTPEGERSRLYKPRQDLHLEDVKIWLDSDDPESWHVITLANNWAVSSGMHGTPSSIRTAEELWNDPVFEDKFGPGEVFWQGYHRDLALGTLNGLPCVMVTRIACAGAGVCFLDPKTLVSIRLPIVMAGFVGEVMIAGGRWLIAVFLKNENTPKNRILVWDLNSKSNDPIGGWFEEVGDVYYLTTVEASANSFQTLQVFHTLEHSGPENYFQLIRFEWPSGKITRSQDYQDLRILPVACTAS